MTTIQTSQEAPTTTPQQQAGAMLQLVAGYAGVRTVDLGLRSGLVAALAETPGATADDLADRLGLDDLYVAVWCRSAYAAGVLERDGEGYRLAEHLGTLLLDTTHPAYVGGLFPLVQQPEMFGRFGDVLASGERLWWDETSPDWIAGVSGTGRPFYTRLVPGGLAQVPGLTERLEAGARVVDHACGAGAGLVRLAQAYPAVELVGVDGDAHSIERARALLTEQGLADRVELVVSPLEDVALERPADVVVNNISMHECRDIDQVTERVRDALVPGGWFVISDFPFPDSDAGLRSVPGRVMCAIQFFEAQIDDQLLPRSAYDALLARHGFVEIGHADITPMHSITWGRRPA